MDLMAITLEHKAQIVLLIKGEKYDKSSISSFRYKLSK
jgi:hypothetical protein